MLLITIYALVFVSALFTIERFIRLIVGSQSKEKQVNLRLKMLKSSNNNLQTYEDLLQMRGLAKEESSNAFGKWFSDIYVQSGLQANLSKKLIFIVVTAIISLLFWRFLFGNNYYLIAGLTAISTITFPVLFILYVRSRRQNKFVMQLSDAIEVMIRSLGAGHPLPAAISLVANEMQDPIGTEFGILSDELTYGIELDEAMLNLVRRMGLDETKLLAVSISVQRGTGGNLMEILGNLSKLVREKTMMKAKIKAISAEGRITAVIMSLFPFFLFLMIRALVPTYFDPLWASGYGNIVISVCGVFMVVGIIILYRLVKFDF